MITIKEIAEELGVSPTTVSNVMNGRSTKMSEKTRAKVREALVKYHYVSPTKGVDTSREIKKILVAYYIEEKENLMLDPFCAEVLGAIELALRTEGKVVIYAAVSSDEQFHRLLKEDTLEGAIVIGCAPDACEPLTKESLKPIVFIDSGDGGYDNIGLQDFEGAYEITSYLLKQGHRSIAFFSQQAYPPLASNLDRLKGFQKALSAYGVKWNQEDYIFLPEDKNIRQEVVRQFGRKRAGKDYTAAFFVSDFYANESVNVLFSQDIIVPDDFSITGFDDNVYARLSRPSLTTVRQLPGEKGKEAVKLLLKRVAGKEVPVRSLRLPTELIVRESVKNVG